MIILTKVLLSVVGVIVQTLLALLIIGSNAIDVSQLPLLHFIILIQITLVTAIWTRHAKNSWRLAAYITGVTMSVIALYLLSPHLQGFARSMIANGASLDSYGFFGSAALGIFLFFGCMLVCGFIVPRAVLRLGRNR